jgi:hypothetical protein
MNHDTTPNEYRARWLHAAGENKRLREELHHYRTQATHHHAIHDRYTNAFANHPVFRVLVPAYLSDLAFLVQEADAVPASNSESKLAELPSPHETGARARHQLKWEQRRLQIGINSIQIIFGDPDEDRLRVTPKPRPHRPVKRNT